MSVNLYEGTKRLYARPMTRGEYNEYRGHQNPADEDPADAGYLVEYTDGSKPNDHRHPGYISWSPKDVFEKAYKRVALPHQQRVLDERADLKDKHSKLSAFILDNPVFLTLPEAEQQRLQRQEVAMGQYLDILDERIAAF